MADTKHGHAPSIPVEGDGISYRGIVWFIVILTVTTLFCQVLAWGFFRFSASRLAANDAPRSTLAQPVGTLPPGPNLLVDEPANLKTFRAHEEEVLKTYGYLNKDLGTIHMPIDKAKERLLEKGLPTRATTTPAPAVAATPADAGKAAPAAAAHKGGF